MSRVLRIIALIVFVLVTFGVGFGLDGIALGLALWVGSTLVD